MHCVPLPYLFSDDYSLCYDYIIGDDVRGAEALRCRVHGEFRREIDSNATSFCKTMVEDGRSVGPQDCAENTQKSMQRTCERRSVDFDHMDNRAK